MSMIIKKIMSLALVTSLVLTACNTATPERYFDVAVLNSNMLNGISGDGSLRDLTSPSAKLKEGTKDQTVIMTRKEMLDNKILYVEQSIKKLNDLQETPATKEMIQTSKALHAYTLNVYKTDYMELAKMYDGGAAEDQIKAKELAIHDKYDAKYEELFDKLIELGKAYAEKHDIKVNWNLGSSPAN